MLSAEQILSFWFADATTAPSRARERYDFWFKATPQIDAEIRERFTDIYAQAKAGELQSWQETPRSCLALIIVLDQFPRNLYRATPAAFATDPQAQAIVQRGLAQFYPSQLQCMEQAFFLMPLQHAEQSSDRTPCRAHRNTRTVLRSAFRQGLQGRRYVVSTNWTRSRLT